MKKYLKIAIVIIAFGVGFFLGRKTIDVEEKIEYVKGETIRDSILVPYPVDSEIPKEPKLPLKKDTLYLDSLIFIVEKVDTAEIIKDYITQKTYEFNVFDSGTLGKFDLKQQIGYNKLLSFDYNFTPTTKQVTQFREPLFTPFVTGGYSTNKTVLLGGGFYYKNIGLEYNMNVSTDRRFRLSDFENQTFIDILNDNRNYHTFKLNYKF